MTKPNVVFQPQTYEGMQKGINQLVDAIRPTLGPRPCMVAIDRLIDNKPPELLDNGAVIARRILQLPDRSADMGAMYLRHILWQVHEAVGDGTATTAVLFQTIFNEGVKYITAGGNAMMLRRHLETGLQLILDKLDQMTVPLQGADMLAQIAETLCYNDALAEALADILDTVGENGRLEIRSGRSREIEYEYLEGSYWESKRFPLGASNVSTHGRQEFIDASILVSNLDLDKPQDLMPFLSMVHQAKINNLVLVVNTVSDGISAMLQQINQKTTELQIVATKTPGANANEQALFMEDLSILTGGQLVLKEASSTLRSVTTNDLGSARRIWLDGRHIGLVRGKGDPQLIRDRLKRLRRISQNTTDITPRRKLQTRIGQLLGGTAVLWVGAATEPELAARKEHAQRAADTLRGAMYEGVVAGGGSALLVCQSALRENAERAVDTDERAAYRILDIALEAPTRALAANAGFEPGVVMGMLAHGSTEFGFDAVSGQPINMIEAGIWDSAAVMKAAVRGAISGAALALGTDVLVQKKNPVQATQP